MADDKKIKQAQRNKIIQMTRRNRIDLRNTPTFNSLSVRQQLFLLHLISGETQISAYEKAGYHGGKNNASNLMARKEMKEARQELMEEIVSENIMNLEEALWLLTQYAYGEDVAELPRDVEVPHSLKAIEMIMKQFNIEDGKADSLADVNISFTPVENQEQAQKIMSEQFGEEDDE